MYESQISFTLDTICPWTWLTLSRTYLAKRRLDEALRQVRGTDAASKVNFTIKYMPYQLYPEASKEGEDKYEWYKKSRYGNSEDKMKLYITLMSAYGATAGIKFKFGGTVANTLDAHRLIQYLQEAKGSEIADKIVNSLYRQYFEEEKHPSSPDTLYQACKDAGIKETEARVVINDEYEALLDVKNLIREQKGNGVDSVPFVIIEGRRRDLTIQGANQVEGYVKALQTIIKEST